MENDLSVKDDFHTLTKQEYDEQQNAERLHLDRQAEAAPQARQVAVKNTQTNTNWMERSNCADSDPAIFFPERGANVKAAKAICNACVVKADCREYAIENNIKTGIWGGTARLERTKIRVQRAKQAKKSA